MKRTIDTDDLDDLHACVTDLRATFTKVLAVNRDLLAIIGEQRADYEGLLAACAEAGSATAALILQRLRAARTRAEADA